MYFLALSTWCFSLLTVIGSFSAFLTLLTLTLTGSYYEGLTGCIGGFPTCPDAGPPLECWFAKWSYVLAEVSSINPFIKRSTVSASEVSTTDALEKKLDSEDSNFCFDDCEVIWAFWCFINWLPRLERTLYYYFLYFPLLICFSEFILRGGKLVDI